ncbi:MAG TPA: hypothetical protein VGK25_11765, partial [Ignavibacteria bacterium]
MKTLIALCFLIISSINIFSQFNHDDQMINPFWEFYGYNYLSSVSAGKGFTGIAGQNDISGFNLNPASIDIPLQNQVNAQYTYKSSQPWLQKLVTDVGLKQQLLSGSIGYGKKITNMLQTGFIYNNPTGIYFDLGEFVRTDEFGNEIGRYEIYYNVVTHSFNLPFVYSVKNFKIGVNLNYLFSRYTFPGIISTPSEPEGIVTDDYT